MIYKSSQICREWWGKFSLKLQEYSIKGLDGKIIPKREIFEQLYKEGTPQIPLFLIMSGSHPAYSLVPRDNYDKAILKQQCIDEAIHELVSSWAVGILRDSESPTTFDECVKMLTDGMLFALDNQELVEACIKGIE